ncbi:MAG: glycoside hydrolase family 25 protein [Eubacteriales bacterium]|nr:glycoside hydrolase family 25 protein [Eubacteriales bacterium]
MKNNKCGVIPGKFILVLIAVFLSAAISVSPSAYAGGDAAVPNEGQAEPDIRVAPGLNYVDNELFYGDADGIPAASIGVDTSFYNGMVDWEQLKEIGVDFALIRVGGRGWGNGSLYTDNWFRNSLLSAQKAGISVGVYFYSMAANSPEAKREALYVIEKLDGIELDLPIYMDMEFSGDYPSGRTDGLPTAERVDFALAFCKEIERAGYSAGIYASESFFHDELNYDAISDYSIWVASYTENNKRPAFENFDIWQFTDSARLPGVSGSCDVNVRF